MATPFVPVEDRFWPKVRKTDHCWEWLAAKTFGYGTIKVAGRMMRAHRVSWELCNGPIPDGLFVCHRCDNPGCVNPAHLFLGTSQENVNDCMAKGRRPRPTKSFKREASCRYGHPYDDANTYYRKEGWRECKQCQRKNHKAYEARKAELVPVEQ